MIQMIVGYYGASHLWRITSPTPLRIFRYLLLLFASFAISYSSSHLSLSPLESSWHRLSLARHHTSNILATHKQIRLGVEAADEDGGAGTGSEGKAFGPTSVTLRSSDGFVYRFLLFFS